MRILSFIALLATLAVAQAPTLKKTTCDHESTEMDRFRGESRDGFFPFVARNYDGSRIEWTFEDTRGVYQGTLSVDKNTKLPMGFAASYKGHLFWAIYSACDEYTYEVTPVSPEQEKQFRKHNPK